MELRTILVCLTGPGQTETLMKFAVPLARKHGAHLIALHTLEALMVYPGIAMHIPEPAYASFNESQKEEAETIRQVFEHYTKNEDFPSELRLIKAEAVSAVDRMIESARAVDLVIMGHEDTAEDRFDHRHAQSRVIKKCGRPVIVVPYGYEGPEVGDKIVVGWSDTREAARAAHDVLDVVNEGASVTVVRVGPPPANALSDFEGVDIVEMYSRHGLKSTLRHAPSQGREIADVLGQIAFEDGSDLIVTGAFGHSRSYDFVIGATSQSLLAHSKLPVLFSK